MNFLGHAYLSFGNAETLCGNLFGDFVKGSHSLTNYPVGIKKGILLHRKIDEFTDTHFAMVDAKNIFRPIYGLYAGAMLDTVMDYFLANDENIFANETTLQLFVQKVYAQLGENSQFFPINFVPYY
jgi:acyl carrier protein phosphodiesterase